MDKNKKTKQGQNVEIEKLKQEVEEFRNKYLRALADYQNLEKRIIQEKEEIKKTGEKQLILKLLPFLDNLEKAEVFIKDHGLKQVKDSFCQLLKSERLEELDVLGKQFDPLTAEVIDIVKGEKDNMVVKILRKGYKFGDKILRVAQVKVSKKLEARNSKLETNSNS